VVAFGPLLRDGDVPIPGRLSSVRMELLETLRDRASKEALDVAGDSGAWCRRGKRGHRPTLRIGPYGRHDPIRWQLSYVRLGRTTAFRNAIRGVCQPHPAA